MVWLVPTPIGNLGDMTLRALDVLRDADAVAAEDTRHSGLLLKHFGISKPLVRLDAHTMDRAPGVLERYPRLAFVSDAGTPGISDPGAELVRLALDLGGRVEVLPGATAFVPALVASGLPAARFTFLGFLARSGREREAVLQAVADSRVTSLVYEAPTRLPATLRDLERVCGPERPAAVARELTKLHEEVARGPLAALRERFAAPPKGEIVIVVGPAEDRPVERDWEALAGSLAAGGLSGRDLRARLEAEGLDRNRAYRLAVRPGGAQGD
ncbi:MAG TPA: 16S rRNA (cytidine(1402)-2'-O)-methyltransferase [Deinococcales bacterium]|nr:16S rRNA (cytidine(1402)-2'-O)-methyltransferase [Deinococcales bacterium]